MTEDCASFEGVVRIERDGKVSDGVCVKGVVRRMSLPLGRGGGLAGFVVEVEAEDDVLSARPLATEEMVDDFMDTAMRRRD